MSWFGSLVKVAEQGLDSAIGISVPPQAPADATPTNAVPTEDTSPLNGTKPSHQLTTGQTSFLSQTTGDFFGSFMTGTVVENYGLY